MPSTPQTSLVKPILLVGGLGLVGLFLWKGFPILAGKDGGDDEDGISDGGVGGEGGIIQAVQKLDVEYSL